MMLLKNYSTRPVKFPKILVLCLLCFETITNFIVAQEIEKITLKKEYKESDYFPSIEGYFQGEIPMLKLGSLDGLITKIGWEIKSFDIDFITGRDYEVFHINSNKIPDSLIIKISNSSIGQLVFFTNITAYDETNTRHVLKNMSLIPIKNED